MLSEKMFSIPPTRTSPRPSSFSRHTPSPFRHEDPTVRTSPVPNSFSPFCLTAVSSPSRPSPSRNLSHHSPRRAPFSHQTGVSHSTPPRRQLTQPSLAHISPPHPMPQPILPQTYPLPPHPIQFVPSTPAFQPQLNLNQNLCGNTNIFGYFKICNARRGGVEIISQFAIAGSGTCLNFVIMLVKYKRQCISLYKI